MINIKKSGDWAYAARLLAEGPTRLQRAIDRVVLQEAHFLRSKIVEGLREQAPGGQAFEPLAPTTLAIRRFQGFGGSKALLVRGDLRNSIAVVRDGEQVAIGILRNATNRDGRSLVDIAAANEFGSRPIVSTLTPRARAFLHAAFRQAGLDTSRDGSPSTGISVRQIPPRPFLAPVFARYAQPAAVAKRFTERLASELRGDFGAP